MTEQQGNEIGRFVGLILVVIGALWIAASGLCTAAFGVGLFWDGSASDLAETSSILLLMLVYGGVSALIGLGIFAIGRWLRPKR